MLHNENRSKMGKNKRRRKCFLPNYNRLKRGLLRDYPVCERGDGWQGLQFQFCRFLSLLFHPHVTQPCLSDLALGHFRKKIKISCKF